MEDRFILEVEDRTYMIERVFLIDGKCFFSILNLATFDVMFGEYLGETVEIPDDNLARIYEDFQNGCKNITFVDGYMEDTLYDVWSDGMMF